MLAVDLILNVRVLLVTRDRELSRRVAGANGDAFAIAHVAWLADAISRLKKNNFQAVIVDLDLPDAQGLETLAALMAVAPTLPILVLGNDAAILQQTKMLEQGAQDYLSKAHLELAELIQAVRRSIARKAREEVLFADKERTQATMKSIGDGVLSTDSAGFVRFLNPVAETLLGWTHAEAAGRHLSEVFEVIDAITRDRIEPRMALEVQKGRTMILPPNCLLVRRDGHESPIEDSAAPILDRSDHIAGMVVVFHDVSESRAMTQKIVHLAEHDVLTCASANFALPAALTNTPPSPTEAVQVFGIPT